jgi:hypothetical protein
MEFSGVSTDCLTSSKTTKTNLATSLCEATRSCQITRKNTRSKILLCYTISCFISVIDLGTQGYLLSTNHHNAQHPLSRRKASPRLGFLARLHLDRRSKRSLLSPFPQWSHNASDPPRLVDDRIPQRQIAQEGDVWCWREARR